MSSTMAIEQKEKKRDVIYLKIQGFCMYEKVAIMKQIL